MIYLDPWVAFAGALLAIYGLERLLVDAVRYVAGRKPKPPETIVKL